jgi:cell wall-associated NlpC family hydrolase
MLGVDCVGLIALVAKDLGIFDYDDLTYSRHANGKDFMKHLHASPLIRVPVAELGVGDVMIFKDNIYPCHCGILAEDDYIIHAFARRKRVVKELLTEDLRVNIVAGFKFPLGNFLEY